MQSADHRNMLDAMQVWHVLDSTCSTEGECCRILCLHLASQVSFNVLIPCMLFTKVAATLAESHHWTLFAIPAIAVLQARRVCLALPCLVVKALILLLVHQLLRCRLLSMSKAGVGPSAG